MITLQRDLRYEVGNPDCTFKVKSGDLITPIKQIGYKTTYRNWEYCDKIYDQITDEDIKDLYIFCCKDNEDDETLIYISIRDDWDLIFVGRYEGVFFDNTETVTEKVNVWVNDNIDIDSEDDEN